MGAAIIGLTALKLHADAKSAQKRAKADIRQAELKGQALAEETNIQNRERQKRVRALAGKQKVSFLNAGLELEGTPEMAIQDVFQTGIEDINLASRNAERTIGGIRERAMLSAESTLLNARTQAIGTLLEAGMSAGIGSTVSGQFKGSGIFGSQGPISRQISFSTTQGQGPIQSFGGFDIGGGLRRGS